MQALTKSSTCNHVYPDNFAIGAESGHLTVQGDLDREGVNMFTLTVQAENDLATGGTPDTVRNYVCTMFVSHGPIRLLFFISTS